MEVAILAFNSTKIKFNIPLQPLTPSQWQVASERKIRAWSEEPLPKDIFPDALIFGRKTVQIKIEIFGDGRPVASIPGQPIFADGKTIVEAKRNLLRKAKHDLEYLRRRKAMLASHLKAKLDFLENLFL